MKWIEPDNFKKDPLGFAGNASGHFLIGFWIFSFMISYVWLRVFGELPYKEFLWVNAHVLYLILIEYKQGWRGWDTIEDTMFTATYGTGIPLFSFFPAKDHVEYLLSLPFGIDFSTTWITFEGFYFVATAEYSWPLILMYLFHKIYATLRRFIDGQRTSI